MGAKIPITEENRHFANEITSHVREGWSDADGVTNNAITPMSSSEQLSTLDGSQSFDAQLSCADSNTFLRVMAQPQPNGNLQLINIQQDTNMDTTLDSYISVDHSMSGICTNGFLSCSDPLNSNTCEAYKWATINDNSPIITAEASPLSDLGGCYCINNQCGSNLVWNNLNKVLSDVAVGMATTLSSKNPYFATKSVEIDGVLANVKGSDGASCNVASVDSVLGAEDTKSITEANYHKNGNSLKAAGYEAENNSPLYQMMKPLAQMSSDETINTCTIERHLEEDNVSMSDIIDFDGGKGSIYEIETGKLAMVIGRMGNNYWKASCAAFVEETSFFIRKPERILGATLKKAYFDDWIQVVVNEDNLIYNGPYGNWTEIGGPIPSRCELKTGWNKNLDVDFTEYLKTEGLVNFKTIVMVAGAGEGYTYAEIDVDASCKVKPDAIVDRCGGYQDSEHCTLLEEEVDDVLTFSNGYPTGLKKLPHSMGNYCGQEQIRDWKKKTRKYRCKSDFDTDFDKIFERVNYVKANSSDDEYKDMIDGSSSQGNLFSFTDDSKTCIESCKTRKLVVETDISRSGNVQDKRREDDTYEEFYYECQSNICPAGTGEEVIQACGCTSAFGEAAASMQMLRLAGQDMICSNGEKDKPQ